MAEPASQPSLSTVCTRVFKISEKGAQFHAKPTTEKCEKGVSEKKSIKSKRRGISRFNFNFYP